MTTTAQTQQASTPAAMTKSDFELLLEKDSKGAIWIKPFGADEEDASSQIPLSRSLIRKYIAVPAWDKQTQKEVLASDEECDKFIALCKARRLNPYEGDAYMIPFWDGQLNRHRWSLITAHQAFLKRAELNLDFNGMESGIIVQRGEQILELVGDFRLDTDKLLGGWSRVHKKGKDYPMDKKVKLTTYIKTYGVWTKDPEGMICKVAEAQNLRDSFPTIIGGMYLREEMEAHEEFQRLVNKEPEVKRPDLGRTPDNVTSPAPAVTDNAAPPATTESEPPKKRGRPGRPTMVEEPLDPPKPPATPPAAQQPPQVNLPPIGQTETAPTTPLAGPAPEGSHAPTEKPEETIVCICNSLNIGMAALINYLHKDNWMKKEQTKITEMSEKKLHAIAKAFTANPEDWGKRILAAQPK